MRARPSLTSGVAAALLAALAPGCRCGAEAPAPAVEAGAAAPADARDPWKGGSARQEAPCVRAPFADALPLAEASGAVYLAPDGERPRVVVVGDSGTRGAVAEIDAETGELLSSSALPLDEGASDDLEGLSARGGLLYAITSAGSLRHWRRVAGSPVGYELIQRAYPIGDAGGASPMVCEDPQRTNCARDYEGLCLHELPASDDACVGFAASKTDGALYCLHEGAAGKLRVDAARRIEVSPPAALTGCDFTPDGGRLLVGDNLKTGNRVSEVVDWQTPDRARVVPLDRIGPGFAEAMAIGAAGVVYRFSDTATAPSLQGRYRCTAAAR